MMTTNCALGCPSPVSCDELVAWIFWSGKNESPDDRWHIYSCASLSWYCPTKHGRNIKASHQYFWYRLLVSGRVPVESRSKHFRSQKSMFWRTLSDCRCWTPAVLRAFWSYLFCNSLFPGVLEIIRFIQYTCIHRMISHSTATVLTPISFYLSRQLTQHQLLVATYSWLCSSSR